MITQSKVLSKEISDISLDSSILIGVEYEFKVPELSIMEDEMSKITKKENQAFSSYEYYLTMLSDWDESYARAKKEWFSLFIYFVREDLKFIDFIFSKIENENDIKSYLNVDYRDLIRILNVQKTSLIDILSYESSVDDFAENYPNYVYEDDYFIFNSEDLIKFIAKNTDIHTSKLFSLEDSELDLYFYMNKNLTDIPYCDYQLQEILGVDNDFLERTVEKLDHTTTATDGGCSILYDIFTKQYPKILIKEYYEEVRQETKINLIESGEVISVEDFIENNDWSKYPFYTENYVMGDYHSTSDNTVWRIETEGSLNNQGIEIISPALPLPEAIKSLEEMLNAIRNNGFTDEDCGLHINLSIKNQDFKNLDIAKLVLFIDEGYVYKFFKSRMNSDYAKSLKSWISSLLPHNTRNINIEDFKQKLINSFPNDKKMGINISSLKDGVNSRIEFRYLGGSDYEYKFKEIKRQIYRFAYCMKIAFNPEYRRIDYLKKLIKLNFKLLGTIDPIAILSKDYEKYSIYNLNGKKIKIPHEGSVDISLYRDLNEIKGIRIRIFRNSSILLERIFNKKTKKELVKEILNWGKNELNSSIYRELQFKLFNFIRYVYK